MRVWLGWQEEASAYLGAFLDGLVNGVAVTVSDDTLEELIVPPQEEEEEGQEARGLTDLYTCSGLCELATWWNVGIKAGYESLGATPQRGPDGCRARWLPRAQISPWLFLPALLVLLVRLVLLLGPNTSQTRSGGDRRPGRAGAGAPAGNREPPSPSAGHGPERTIRGVHPAPNAGAAGAAAVLRVWLGALS